jgi:DNA polymerase III delta prime subunit
MRIWPEDYRPKKFEEMILPDEYRQTFKHYLSSGLPNVIFYGSPGSGKTTAALIFIKELGAEHLRLNGSDTRGIDIVRDEIKNFIQARSFNSKRKIVFFDEGEALTPPAMKALKELTERYQKHVSFIFCTNHLYVFPDALRSRFTLFEFRKPTKEEGLKLIRDVLEKEKVKYEPETLDKVYRLCAGDLRRSLVFLQRYSISGELKLPEDTYIEIYKLIKAGSIQDIKRYFASHSIDYDGLYRFLYERIDEPNKLALLSKHAYQDALVVDKEINFVGGFIAELLKLKQ